MVNFGAIIGESVKWARAVTFKPFDARKWIILVSLALFAGYGVAGCNVRLNNMFPPQEQRPATIEHKAETAPQGGPQSCPQPKGAPGSAADLKSGSASDTGAAVAVFVIGLLFLGFIILLPFLIIFFMWLGARLAFVFLEDIVNNDELIKVPFIRNKVQGNSLFKFNLVVTLIFFAALILLAVPWIMTAAKTGIFDSANPSPAEFGKALMLNVPYFIVLLALLFAGGLISLILRDFIVPAMFKGGIKVMQAWREILGLLRANLLNFVVYVLIKMGLAICVGIGYTIAVVVAYLGLMFPVVGTVLVFVLLFAVTPQSFAAYAAYTFLGFGVLLVFILLLMLCLTCLGLPFSVFFRTFAVKFLASLDGKYDLFASRPPESRERQMPKDETSPALAAVFSFLSPGLGQIYNGQIKKGLAIYATFWLIVPWIIGIVDAYKTAVRIKSGELSLERKLDASEPRAPALACAMSFLFPGTGQIYNGQAGKGFLVFLLSVFIIPWILGIIDAYRTAKAINAGRIHAERRIVPTVAAAIGIMAIVITVIVIFIIGIIIASISNPEACG